MTEIGETKNVVRLSANDWILVAYRRLVREGVATVRVETLARDLGATKGSFYWHFRNLAALKAAMLARWVQLATDDISAAVMLSNLPARQALLALVDRISILPDEIYGGASIEPAIRDWGRFDMAARDVVANVDRARIEFVTLLFGNAGLVPEQAAKAAQVFYAGVVGAEHLRLSVGMDMKATLGAIVDQWLPLPGQ